MTPRLDPLAPGGHEGAFTCPRCERRCGPDEGGTDSPLCDGCWSDVTKGGERPVPELWGQAAWDYFEG